MILRIIWYAGLLAVALCISAAQIDRSARFDAELSPLVPAAFRGFAQQHFARAAMAGEDTQRAQEQTRHLVRVRPVPAEHLTALALAASANGEETMAIQALEAAASRGWREPVSQMAVVEASLLDENFELAAQRLIALWSVDPSQERLNAYTARQFETSDGRAAFARAMPVKKRWRRNFQANAQRDIDTEIVQQVIDMAPEVTTE